MDRIKGLIAFWATIIGAELAACGLAVLVFSLSPVLRERAFEAMLVPNVPLLRAIGANQLRHYPSRAAAVALVALLNLQDKEGVGQDPSAEALASLRELSGEPFQPGWKEGDAFDVPTDFQAWSETVARVNSWAFNTLGPEALARLSASGLLGDGNLTVTTRTQAGDSVSPASAEPEPDPSELSYDLPEGGKITLSLGDTSGMADRLSEAGIDPDARFYRAAMSGDPFAVREILDSMMYNVQNGDTAEAVGVYRFFERPLPEPVAAPAADESAGETAAASTEETEPSAEPAANEEPVSDGETGATE